MWRRSLASDAKAGRLWANEFMDDAPFGMEDYGHEEVPEALRERREWIAAARKRRDISSSAKMVYEYAVIWTSKGTGRGLAPGEVYLRQRTRREDDGREGVDAATGLSHTTVSRSIGRLVTLGLLEAVDRPRYPWQSKVYRVRAPWEIPETADSRRRPPTPRECPHDGDTAPTTSDVESLGGSRPHHGDRAVRVVGTAPSRGQGQALPHDGDTHSGIPNEDLPREKESGSVGTPYQPHASVVSPMSDGSVSAERWARTQGIDDRTAWTIIDAAERLGVDAFHALGHLPPGQLVEDRAEAERFVTGMAGGQG